jgi:hypothetical protein
LSGSVADRPAARRPSGLLGMLALVLVVEASIAGLRDDLIRPLGESWRFASKAAETQATGCDVLCFGDSLVKYGVLPKEIEARTGLRAYGLASSGGTSPSSFFLLRRALDAGARPRAIVVDFEALMPVEEGPPGLLSYPELATARDCLDLARASNDPDFFGAAMVAKWLPSARYRFEIRDGVRAALDGRSNSERDSVRSHRLIWARERGAQPTEPVPVRFPAPTPMIDRFCPEAWSCPPRDEAYIDRFLDLAGSRGIAVYWLLPPLAPEVSDHRLARGSEASYERFARAIVARHPNTTILDARASGYESQTFIDPLHLDQRGAAVLTADVAERLAEDLGRRDQVTHWVALPRFGGRSSEGVARAGEVGKSSR